MNTDLWIVGIEICWNDAMLEIVDDTVYITHRSHGQKYGEEFEAKPRGYGEDEDDEVIPDLFGGDSDSESEHQDLAMLEIVDDTVYITHRSHGQKYGEEFEAKPRGYGEDADDEIIPDLFGGDSDSESEHQDLGLPSDWIPADWGDNGKIHNIEYYLDKPMQLQYSDFSADYYEIQF
eukprot:CAMPEP_0201593680 /NCGR_PEP_ID=MMETSP0190_2-20130828/191216_1 /ASSEMBLY_ACC=CAM_ASM_000263 /TAXON_ID=37353 /ORGANISM="Rosalina sp." /LENGTH=176 /DNA_ID=CAMNT_0048052971 /DNA_START=153 /DNA_END=680 /DNA_ORIENTATION=+